MTAIDWELVAAAYFTPSLLVAARIAWLECVRRRRAVAFDRVWEQNARMLGARGGSR